jgi:hypothetical protein
MQRLHLWEASKRLFKGDLDKAESTEEEHVSKRPFQGNLDKAESTEEEHLCKVEGFKGFVR